MKRLLSFSIFTLLLLPAFCQQSKFGYYLAPYDTLRILIVFAEIDYTGDTICSDPDLYPDDWNAGQLPTWKDELLDPVWSGAPVAKLTQYYYEASFGKLIVLGDYLVDSSGIEKPVVVPSTTLSTTIYRGQLVRSLDDSQVIPYISPQYKIFKTKNSIAQSMFDQWSSNSAGAQKLNTPNNYYDEVWFFFRNSGQPANACGHSSGSTSSIFGKPGQYHSAVCISNAFPKNIMTHELNHWYLGGNYFHAGGGLGAGPGYVIAAQGGWGMLGGANSAFLTCNAWDRRRMAWHLPGSYPINARDSLNQTNIYADFDATDSTDEGIYILRDFWTTGDALRIKLPNIPSNKHQQWLWIEFHQTVSGNQSQFDDFMYGDNACVDNPIPGMYAYIQIDKEDTSGSGTYSGYADYLRFLSARGNFDIDSSASKQFSACIVGSDVNPLILAQENPLSGLNTLEERPVDLDTNLTISKDEGLRWYSENLNGSIINNLPCNGTANIAFTENGNNEINIASNPSSANVMTLVSDNIIYDNVRNIHRVYINGVSIKILDQIGDSLLKVKISFDDFNLDNDRRWCADSIMLPAVQTGALYSMKVEAALTLDWSTVPTRINNPIAFNGENYYSSPTVFSLMPSSKCIIDGSGMIVSKDSSTIELQTGSTMEVNQGGILWIKPTTRLVLQSGCTLRVKDGGQVIIEDTASFVYNGGTIILEGNNSVIEFKGNLVIADNTTFTYSGNGYLLFSKTGYPSTNIVPGTNSKIWLNGSGNTDKVLEISQETMYALGLAEFKITNAKVELHNDSRLSVDGPIVLTGAAFTSNTGSNNQHRGVTVFGQNGISINGCSFSYGKYGLYSINTYGGNGLTLNNCTFHHNETGLVTVDKYASMVECTFINNTLFGWEAIGMTQPSTATLSYFHYNFQGIKYEASSTSGLFLNGETRVDYNEFMGVEFFGNATLSLNCAKVRFNGIYYSTAPGILLHHGASVNMSPSQNPSCNRNAAQGNYYTIMTEDPANPGSSNNYLNFIHLGGGYNNLTPLAGTMAVKGKVKGYSCIPSSTSENNNMWKSTYTAPIWNVDYQTYNANCRPGTPLYLTDNGPGYLSCSGGGSSSSSMAGFSIVEDITESDGDQIYISSLDYPYSSLTSATNNATYYLTAYDAVGNDSTALNRLTQIINYLLDNPYPTSDESLYNLLSYCQLAIAGINNQVNQLSSSINNDPIFSLLGIYDRLIAAKNPSDSASYIAWFELSLGKAHLYHTMGLYDLALNEIDIMYPFSRKDQLSVLDRWYCLISNEKDLKNKNITPDEFALSLTLCNLGLRNMENGISYSENPTNAYSECDFHVFPNPAKTVITFTLPDNAYYLIYVYNASGNEVIKTNTNDLGFCELSVANLPTGLYFIEAVGQKVFRAKFIKD